MDTVAQIQGHLLAHQYEGLIKKAKLRGDEVLVDRISGRYSCASCGTVYHDTSKKPKQDGVCDKCGSTEFKRRSDDQPDKVWTRLQAYYKETSPLIGYYYAKGLLKSVDGLQSIEDVAASIDGVLDKF
jgi:adenylate kinase